MKLDYNLGAPPRINAYTLLNIMPTAHAVAARYIDPLQQAADTYLIYTAPRLAAWLAQLAHESGGLHYTQEVWGPTAAQQRYEGRQDLGNTHPGDGYRYRGRGLLQITGRANYARCSLGLYGDANVLLDEPQRLEQPLDACRSAAWYWHERNLNALADAEDYLAITRRINGGTNGWHDRLAYYQRARAALGMPRWEG